MSKGNTRKSVCGVNPQADSRNGTHLLEGGQEFLEDGQQLNLVDGARRWRLAGRERTPTVDLARAPIEAQAQAPGRNDTRRERDLLFGRELLPDARDALHHAACFDEACPLDGAGT